MHYLDIDECETECTVSIRVCQNTYGSYLCTCVLGYIEVGEECTDVDECNSNIISPCQHQCTNVVGEHYFSYTFILYILFFAFIGSFVCECNPGYALQTDGATCKAVSNTFICPGGYTCQDNECAIIEENTVCSYCERGTELSSDGTTCVDLDECLQSDICPYPSSFCQNTNPLYFCECNQGYIKNSQVN